MKELMIWDYPEELVDSFYELTDLAGEYVRKHHPYNHGEIRINEYGSIESYENTACHCHPEYEWVHVANQPEFLAWLKKKKEENQSEA